MLNKILGNVMLVIVLFGYSSADVLSAVLREEVRKLVHHEMNISNWHTPIASYGDDIYIVYIDRQLRTVIGQRKTGKWKFRVIESNTAYDKHHTLPSIGVDEDGYIHVVYNMHSTPWQYKRSVLPRDITQWEFLGQPATDEYDNVPGILSARLGPGTAAIPGNQITYPAFTSDRNGKLYLSFRECADCSSSSYFERNWSSGIVSYDVGSRAWHRVQGERFATFPDKVSLGISMFFDASNRMHVSWVYGNAYDAEIGAANFHDNPNQVCYVYSDDGGESFSDIDNVPMTLPIGYGTSLPAIGHGWVTPHTNGYYSGATEIGASADGNPHILVFPRTVSANAFRGFRHYDGSQWRPVKRAPFGGSHLIDVRQSDSLVTVVSGQHGIQISTSRDYYDNWFTETFYAAYAPFKVRMDYSYSQIADGVRLFAVDQNDVTDSKVIIATVVDEDGTVVPDFRGTTYQANVCPTP